MPTMPPFVMDTLPSTGKAIRNPDGRQMRRYERQFEAAMKKALERLRLDVQRGIGDGNVHEMAGRLSDPAVTRPFQDAIVRELQAVALAGSEFGREQVEKYVFGTAKALEVGMWELANNAAAAWAITFGQTLAGMMLMTTTERIQNEIANYILNSETMGQLIQRIRLGNVYSEERARQLAVTEVTRAFAEGNMAAWRAAGVIEKRRWNTNNDELVCPVCGPLAGQVRGLDDEFGDGIPLPPAHPRCRCWITPVVD